MVVNNPKKVCNNNKERYLIMSQTIYIVTEINSLESPGEVSTAKSFYKKETAIAYLQNIIADYKVDPESIIVDEEKDNWYSADHFDISLFKIELE